MTVSEFINKVGFKVKNEDVKKVNGTISDIKNTATKLLGAIGIGFSLAQINQIVEEFGRVNTQIKSSTQDLGDQDEIQRKILDSATKTRTSYEDTANTISKLVQENKQLFGNVEEAVKFNDAATMLFKTAGKTNEEVSGLMESINKSFAKGKVETETINQLIERSPEAVNLLNKKLGTTTEQLQEIASEGKITIYDLKDAFVDSLDTIEKDFGDVRYTISDALLHIRNKWGFWLADMDKTLGVTNSIAKFMVSGFNGIMRVLDKVKTGFVWLADKVGGTNNLLKLLAITAAALFIAFNFEKIKSGLMAIKTFLTGIHLKTLAIIAIIIILALIVDDFVNFMQGNNSLMGSMLEKAGVDCDALRETIIGAWDAIKEKLAVVWEHLKEAGSKVWDGIKTAAEAIFEALKAFWAKWGDETIDTFTKIFGFMGDMFNGFIDIIVGLADFIAAVFSGDWAAAWEAIKDIFVGILNVIVASLSIAWEQIKLIFQICLDFVMGLWTTIWNSIVSFIQNILNTIIAAILTFCSDIWNNIASTFTNIWNSITSTVGNIKSAIVDGFTEAIDWIKALPGQALQWGKDIIMGIVNGIKSSISAVGDAVSEVANKIKSFLHFSEPDEGPLSDFHTYMPDMIDLMSKGIIDGKSKVKDALGGLTGEMAVMAKADVVASSTAAAARGGNNISKSVVQNVEINNEFNGDAAIQRSASSAMDNSAKDITAQLARGLAFAR